MERWLGLLNLVQALVYLAAAYEGAGRWMPAAVVMGTAAAAQVFAGVWSLLGKESTEPLRYATGITLAAVAVVLGLYLQVAVHIIANFTPVGAASAWQLLGGMALAMPWFVALPLVQFLRLRPARPDGAATAVVALIGIVLPPAWGAMQQGQTRGYAPIDGAVASKWIYNKAAGPREAWMMPVAPGPVLLQASLVADGKLLQSQTLSGGSLELALGTLTIETQVAGAAVYLDVAIAEQPHWTPWLAPPGTAFVPPALVALRTSERLVGSYELWRSKAVGGQQIATEVPLTSVQPAVLAAGAPDAWVQVESWLADSTGARKLHQTWTAPPELTADSALQAAVAGGRHTVRNMRGGRFAYVVQGPSGTRGGGYNYPRHAGGTWFLARLATRTGDPEIRDAALRALDFLGDATVQAPRGRGFVLDPKRKDGKAWVGTTGLALLAAIELDARMDLQLAWSAFVVSSVDDDGVVRGDYTRADDTWHVQPAVTYAQGQGMLALASATRADLVGARAALERAADHVESGSYWPAAAGRMFTLDEHWMCLAALATDDAIGTPAGQWICEAYLHNSARFAAPEGAVIPPPSGPMGAVAEAWLARAELDRRAGREGPWRGQAERLGRAFLAAQYRTGDRPMVGSGTLIGGFRDNPWRLDVRVDAVQHIGCALLGLEQILRGEPIPGAMP